MAKCERCGGSGLTMGVLCGQCGEPPVAASSTGSAASPDNRAILETMHNHAPEKEREMTPMDDAVLMLDLWDTCITKKIKIERRSPLHRLVVETLQRLRQNDPR